ncbi:hypothetical protein [Solimonas soli]|uniref:hypothetical protein n=1 Tax=Solimonas soli TaxID=413479 RepID=UPI0004B32D91|nr:hypothetical protein [Solimonas soli]
MTAGKHGSGRSSRVRGGRAHRLAVLSRVLAAVFGGYLLTSLATALLAHLLPGPRAESVLAATMLSFALYAGIVLWVFAANSAARVWRGLGIAIGLSGAVLLLVQRGFCV